MAGGKSVIEIARSRQMAMCCGGGGARVWMEDEGKERINYNRMRQILETGGEAAVACHSPVMLEDAFGALDVETVRLRDIASYARI
jgi:Fe-S oxidoreductase